MPDNNAAIARILQIMSMLEPLERERAIDLITEKYCPDCGHDKPCRC